MKKFTTKDALITHDKRKGARQNWDDVWDEIAYYVLPSQTGFITVFSPGEKQRWSRRFDTTASYANKTLANHLHMSMVSPSKPWFEVRLQDKELGKVNNVKKWLEDSTEKMYLAFSESNFNPQINTAFQIFCAIGSGCIEVNFEAKPTNPFTLLFRSNDLGLCTFDYNAAYQIDTKVEEYKFTARQAMERFGDELPKESMDRNNPTEVKLLKITRPNPDYNPAKEVEDPKSRAYLVEWCWNKKVFKVESAFEQPFMLFRVSEIKQDGIYGEGFGLSCLSDIRSINRLKMLELRAVEKGVDPPLVASAQAVMSDLDIDAGGLTIMRNPRDIGELPGQMKQNIVMYKSEDLRNSILQTYAINEIMVPERKGQNPITATEVQVRQEQSQKMLGAAVGRIKDELLTPLLERVFGLMLRNGRFLEMPEELSGQPVEMAFVGPLAKAQNIDDAYAVERALQTSMGISQVTQKVSKVINYDEAERLLYDRYGVPASVIRSEDEVKAMEAEEKAAEAERAEQENQMANAQIREQESNADTADVELMSNIRGI